MRDTALVVRGFNCSNFILHTSYFIFHHYAVTYLGQGGIPNLALTRSGVIKQFEIEQIWVEAWIDYLPSRGAKHSKGDSWIAMDASFKQYEFSEGLDLETSVPFDAKP